MDYGGSDDDLRQAIALFRYGVIADLVHLPLGTPGIGDKLRDKASQPYTISVGSTLRHSPARFRVMLARMQCV